MGGRGIAGLVVGSVVLVLVGLGHADAPGDGASGASAHDRHPRRAARHAHRPAATPAATYVVTRVVDGDTVELGTGQTVRLVGIDTPERGQCGYDQATRH